MKVDIQALKKKRDVDNYVRRAHGVNQFLNSRVQIVTFLAYQQKFI